MRAACPATADAVAHAASTQAATPMWPRGLASAHAPARGTRCHSVMVMMVEATAVVMMMMMMVTEAVVTPVNVRPVTTPIARVLLYLSRVDALRNGRLRRCRTGDGGQAHRATEAERDNRGAGGRSPLEQRPGHRFRPFYWWLEILGCPAGWPAERHIPGDLPRTVRP